MEKIAELARTEYFAHKGSFSSALNIYTEGYQKGFQKALETVREALDVCPNNKERLEAIKEIIKKRLDDDRADDNEQ